MLKENIKAIRKSKGLSQEELAIKLNVVRQTISKWEQGLSVPDSDMLISISEVFETSVSTLLGETIVESKVDDLKAISEKLEVINLQLAQRKATRRKMLHWLLISLCQKNPKDSYNQGNRSYSDEQPLKCVKNHSDNCGVRGTIK